MLSSTLTVFPPAHVRRYLLNNLDWLEEELGSYEDEYLIIDCPGESKQSFASSYSDPRAPYCSPRFRSLESLLFPLTQAKLSCTPTSPSFLV